MKRVASLYLPNLSIDRLRRIERGLRPSSSSAGHSRSALPVDHLRAGGWRPGANWAQRETRQAEIDALPSHQRPPMRMLGQRSEPAEAPFRFPGEGRGPGGATALFFVEDWTPAFAGELLVTTQRSGQRIVLAAVSPEAAALGLRPGMPVTQARALVPGLDLRGADPEGDAAFLTRLALFAARRWTPAAALSGPDGLWLDLSGVSHLFGGERRLCGRILRFCARLGFEARIAIAGTTGAAHALARFSGQDISLCPNGQETEAVASFPPAALRLEDAAIRAARRFGIESVLELLTMPRGPLARRLGKNVLTRLDQALGKAGESFDPILPKQPPQASLRFVEPIASAEAIERVLADLIAMLMTQLEQQGLGARRLGLMCDGVDGLVQKLAIGTAAASRDGPHLLRLLAMKIEQIEPGFGIESMHLVASRCEPLAARQIDHALAADNLPVDLPPLIDRVASRIGPQHVFRSSAVESDVPERSVRHVSPLAQASDWPCDWPRPARLLPFPERVEKVIAELPDQAPVRFSWRGTMHRVCKADGPERVHGEWWKHNGEADAVRDYFQVEDESGARFWLLRRGDGVDGRTGDLSWWMHGVMG